MDSVFTDITDYLLNQSWQIAILFGVVAIICMAIRKKTAHLRYLLWLLIIAKCLVPSLITVSLAILPQRPQPEPVYVPPEPASAITLEPVIEAPDLPVRPITVPPKPTILERLAQIRPKIWFSGIWLGGAGLYLFIVLIKAARFNRRLKGQRKTLTAGMQKEIDELLGRFGVHAKLRIWLLDGIGQPFVWGLLRGSIYLPANFGQIGGREHRRGILMHEITHVARFDAAVNCLQAIAQAVFWFHPLVWLANRNIRAEREKCCDETAIARLSAAPKVYSSAIVDTLIAEYQSTQPIPSLAIAGPIKNIEDRIKTIMKPGKKFYNRPTIIAIVTILLLAIAAVPTTIALTHKQPEKPEEFLPKAASEYTSTLPNGVKVELVGVCKYPSQGKEWWRPDGRRLDTKIITKDYSGYTSEDPGYEMAFKFSGQDFSVSFKDIKGSKQRSSLVVLEPEGIRASRIHIKPKLSKTSMKVGVAAGKWETVATHTGGGSSVEFIKRFLSRKKIIFSGATETKEGPVMTVSDDLEWGIDTALFAVDKTGAEYKGETQTSLFVHNMQQQTFVFGDVLLEDIKEFQFRTRPYEWVKFKDVALRPKFKPDVQVEGEGNKYNLMARGGKGRLEALDPNAVNLIRRYLKTLEQSDWKSALSMCSISVMDKARQYPTPESFFDIVVPVKEILNNRRDPRIGYWQRPPKYFAYIFDVRISQPDLPRDVFWVWEARRLEGRVNWEIDFSAIPFETWLANEKREIIRVAQEKEQLIKELAPRLKGVSTLLATMREEFLIGEPIYCRLRIINQGDSILSYDSQQVAVNNSMTIKGPDGKEVKYTAGPFQTQGGPVLIKPGETKTLFDQFDITKQYDIRKPGQYRVQFNGRGLEINIGKEDASDLNDPPSFEHYPSVIPSNVVAITIHSGIKQETLDVGKDGVEGEKAVSQTNTEDKADVQVEGKVEKTGSLVWGEAVNGLSAALEFIPEKESYSLGEEIGIRVHIQNMSDKVIQVAIVRGRTFPGYPIIENMKGEKLAGASSMKWTGKRRMDRRTLNPGQTVVLEADKGFAISSNEIKGFKDSESVYKLKAGQYRTRYKLFLKQWSEDDWSGALETGKKEMVIAPAFDPENEPDVQVEKFTDEQYVDTQKRHETITFHHKDMTIRDGLQFLGKKYKKNIIPSDNVNVNQRIPVSSLYDVNFEEILQAIIGTHKYIIDGNFIRVYTEQEYNALQINKKTNVQVEAESQIKDGKAERKTLSFGPVIVREMPIVINEDDPYLTDCLIDFETGKLFKLPQALKDMQNESEGQSRASKWCKENGIDAAPASFFFLLPDKGYIGGTGLVQDWAGKIFLHLSNDSWNSITPDTLLKKLQHQKLDDSAGVDEIPETFGFKTLEGNIGLLQIIGFTDESRGIKIRYKMVQLPDVQVEGGSGRKVDYSSATVEEGVGFDDIIVGSADCKKEFIKSRLGPPDEETKDRQTNAWWLNYREKYGLDFWLNKQNVLCEIRLNEGFKGKLISGISMTSTMKDVFDVYGKPISERIVDDLTKHFDNQVLYKRRKPINRKENYKIFYNQNWLLFWFEGDKVSQIVIYPKQEKPDVQVEGKTAKANNKTEAAIKGLVVDSKGQGVADVQVRCVYIRGDFPMGTRWSINTDSRGQYQFAVSAPFSYKIEVGGLTATHAVSHSESKKLNVIPNEIYQVENLIVRVRPTNNCNGRVIFEDGQPAANLSYGYVSQKSSFLDSTNLPRTNNRGEFVIEHILPDELFSFYIFPKENTFCVWKRLGPNSRNLEFTLKTSESIELPTDWSMVSTQDAIARNMTFAKDSRIQFSLPDLQGNKISLEDQRFKNKAVLVNIYGSWCGGCRLEIPYLVDFKNKYQKEGLEIIGIAFEYGSKEEQLQAVKEIVKEFKVNYPLLIGGVKDTEKVSMVVKGLELFGGFPTTLYIDRNGLVKHIQTGFWLFPEGHKQWQIKQVEGHIKSLLNVTVN